MGAGEKSGEEVRGGQSAFHDSAQILPDKCDLRPNKCDMRPCHPSPVTVPFTLADSSSGIRAE